MLSNSRLLGPRAPDNTIPKFAASVPKLFTSKPNVIALGTCPGQKSAHNEGNRRHTAVANRHSATDMEEADAGGADKWRRVE
jgi:hypothetical protein